MDEQFQEDLDYVLDELGDRPEMVLMTVLTIAAGMTWEAFQLGFREGLGCDANSTIESAFGSTDKARDFVATRMQEKGLDATMKGLMGS